MRVKRNVKTNNYSPIYLFDTLNKCLAISLWPLAFKFLRIYVVNII